MKNKIKMPKKIVVASFNEGKVREIKHLFQETPIEFISVSKFVNKAPDETGTTFVENSLIKARNSFINSHTASIADDSGLCINSLNGDPGIYSARWAGKNKNFSNAINIIKKKLENKKDKSAYFICVLALVLNNQSEYTFTGRVEGKISFPPKGVNGFGYDPIFIPKGQILTFGEMDPKKKETISHRFQAYKKMREMCVD